LVIPKELGANLAWRGELVRLGKTSAAHRRAIIKACSASPIYFANAFLWTYLQKKIDAEGHEAAVYGGGSNVPFITWKPQDDAICSLLKCIDEGTDALINKSRDMGATWVALAVIQWYFQFRPNTTFLEMSRKELLVDRRGDMDSLFEKHRFMLRWQPAWLRPKVRDTKLHLENTRTRSTIEGESTNENAGQASRKTAIFIDEAARISNLAEIDLATADTSACRIFNSTPGGPIAHFTTLYRDFTAGRRAGKLINLPWWQHPEKGKGARIEVIKDEFLSSRLSIPVGQETPVSDWLIGQTKKRSNRNMSQNILGEHGRTGDMLFDPDEVERHRTAFQRNPMAVGTLVIEDDTEEHKITGIKSGKMDFGRLLWVPSGSWNPWRLWVPLIPFEVPVTKEKVLRPNQNTRYVFGIDISIGSGASNSVISVLDHGTNMIVAKFWDAFTSPEALADIAAFSALWFGGRRPPLIAFEKNGPGLTFGRKLVKLGYPNIYYQKSVESKSSEKTDRWGWHSTPARKELLIGAYRDALAQGLIINPCKEALDEALDYVYDSSGRIEPGSLGVEEGGGHALHGDHVIADALLVEGRRELPAFERCRPAHAPDLSWASRREVAKKAGNEREAWSR
jgi:hypothetical protein